MIAEKTEELPTKFVDFFERKMVNENLLHRLSQTLRPAEAVLQHQQHMQSMDPDKENWHLHLCNVLFQLRELADAIGDQNVTELQCRELEEIISKIEEHLATIDDRQNCDAADPISSAMNFDLWEKKQCIGSSGYGFVYAALNRKTGESCAIKEICIDDSRSTQALRKEIQILSRLEHQNIVKYYGRKIVASQIALYMEYVQPGSLKKYISSRGALQESLVRNFTAQILSGLAYLHSQRVVHRDIKPDNLLVDSENNVKLVDFGLAKHLAQSVGNHSVWGTLYYAAPEVMWQDEYKCSGEASAADIWSLGCVVIEMFTGKHPWPDCSLPLQVMGYVGCLKQHPAIPENLSIAGQGFLQSCFMIDPAKRPSAADLQMHPFVKAQTYRGA